MLVSARRDRTAVPRRTAFRRGRKLGRYTLSRPHPAGRRPAALRGDRAQPWRRSARPERLRARKSIAPFPVAPPGTIIRKMPRRLAFRLLPAFRLGAPRKTTMPGPPGLAVDLPGGDRADDSGSECQGIRERAYHLWLEEGRPHGRHDEHWRRAERELIEEESRLRGASEARDPATSGARGIGAPAAAERRRPVAGARQAWLRISRKPGRERPFTRRRQGRLREAGEPAEPAAVSFRLGVARQPAPRCRQADGVIPRGGLCRAPSARCAGLQLGRV